MCFVAVAVIALLPLALHLNLLQLLKITLQKCLWGRKAFLPMLSQNQESQTHTSRALYEAGAVHWTQKTNIVYKWKGKFWLWDTIMRPGLL